MRIFRITVVLSALSLLLMIRLNAANGLLPGLTYLPANEALPGKLTFHLAKNANLQTNNDTAASIYELDLSNGRLREVTECPKGLFISAYNEETFCVIYWSGKWYLDKSTNIFLYSDSLNKRRSLTLDRQPKATAILSGHALFEMEHTNGTRLVDYDIAEDRSRSVELANASPRQYQEYGRIHVPRGQTNILHFYYSGFGKRLGAAIEYRNGFYGLNVRTGEIQWIAELTNDRDDPGNVFKTFDDRYVFFEGANAPIHGLKLVSSRWDEFRAKDKNSKESEIKVLKTFSRPFTAGAFYTLLRMSPDGRFAFIKYSEPVSGKSGMPAAVNTYYVVDVSNGNTTMLLKDDVQRTTGAFMSDVWWIR